MAGKKSFYDKNKDANKALAESGSQQEETKEQEIQQENEKEPKKQRGRNKTQETMSSIIDIPVPSISKVPEYKSSLEPSKPTKRKPGRPTTKDVKNTCRNVNVALPVDLLDRWDAIKAVHGSNLTAYITSLIKKDMDANFDKYINIINAINNI